MIKPPSTTATDLWVVRLFLAALAFLLVGYMFLGRGFAHLGVPPLYVGEIVLALGLAAAAVTLLRARPALDLGLVHWLLLGFMAWGLVRTVPYLAEYGIDALRDAVLWSYALFALIVYVLVDRAVLVRGFRWYGFVIPVFAIWLPIAWTIFGILYRQIDPTRPGEVIPLVYFKSGDMAVHIVGAIAFLVVTAYASPTGRRFLWRAALAVPLIWTLFVTWTSNRGAMVATVGGVAAAIVLMRHPRRWAPVVAGGVLAVAIFTAPTLPFLPGPSQPPVTVTTPSPSVTPSLTARPTPRPTVTPTPTPAPTVADPDAPGRQVGVTQLIDNILSIFGVSSDSGLTGTRAARLAWWGTIIDYTVFGPHFWLGKGFGVNLASDDGFQSTADESLRAPHNSHLTALARMGVPGFLAWIALQGTFAVGLLRSLLRHRRSGDLALAMVGTWVLVYWVAMMLNTSFDPYLEGPQGGIWFWSLFGIGLVVMRAPVGRREA